MRRNFYLCFIVLASCSRESDTSLEHGALYDENANIFAIKYHEERVLGDWFELFHCRRNEKLEFPNLEPLRDIDKDCPSASRVHLGSSTVGAAKSRALLVLDDYGRHLRNIRGRRDQLVAQQLEDIGGYESYEGLLKQAAIWQEEMKRLREFLEIAESEEAAARIDALMRKLRDHNTRMESIKPAIDELKGYVDETFDRINTDKVVSLSSNHDSGTISYEYFSFLIESPVRTYRIGEATIEFRWVPDSSFTATHPFIRQTVRYDVPGFWLQTKEATVGEVAAIFGELSKSGLQANIVDVPENPDSPFQLAHSNRKVAIPALGGQIEERLKYLGLDLRLPYGRELAAASRCGMDIPAPLSFLMYRNPSDAPWNAIWNRGEDPYSPDARSKLNNPCGFQALFSNLDEIFANQDSADQLYGKTVGVDEDPSFVPLVRDDRRVYRAGFRFALGKRLSSPPLGNFDYSRYWPSRLSFVGRVDHYPPPKPPRRLSKLTMLRNDFYEEDIFGFRRDRTYDGPGIKVNEIYENYPFASVPEFRPGIIITNIYNSDGTPSKLLDHDLFDHFLILDLSYERNIKMKVYNPYDLSFKTFTFAVKPRARRFVSFLEGKVLCEAVLSSYYADYDEVMFHKADTARKCREELDIKCQAVIRNRRHWVCHIPRV